MTHHVMFREEFSYIPDASFSESTLFLPVLVWGFSYTPDASFNVEFVLQSSC